MRAIIGLLAMMALASPLAAADLKLKGDAVEHKFVTVTSDKAGQWLVLGPNAAVVLDSTNLAGTPVLGAPRINRASSLTTDGGKGVIFVGAAGFYAVTQWGIEGEAEPSVLVVEIKAGVVPVPPGPPPPKPDPPKPDPVPPKPDPTPAGPRSLLLVRESAETTPALARLVASLRSGPSQQYLRANGHRLDILDDDEVGSDGKPSKTLESWRPHFTGMKLPVLIIFDSKTTAILHKESLGDSATDATVIAILKANGG